MPALLPELGNQDRFRATGECAHEVSFPRTFGMRLGAAFPETDGISLPKHKNGRAVVVASFSFALLSMAFSNNH